MAPTFVLKALKRIAALEYPNAKDRPSNDSLQLISESCNGDLRSAINSLEFLASSGSAKLQGAVSGLKKRGGRTAKTVKGQSLRKMCVAFFSHDSLIYRDTPRDYSP